MVSEMSFPTLARRDEPRLDGHHNLYPASLQPNKILAPSVTFTPPSCAHTNQLDRHDSLMMIPRLPQWSPALALFPWLEDRAESVTD